MSDAALQVHGNKDVWEQFERDLPVAALLEGPGGVGKFTGATQAAERLSGYESIVRYQNTTVKDVRELALWLGFQSDSAKVAILEPGACHPNVWALLKGLLENQPKRSHVWIVGSYEHPVPRGIRDRCFTYAFQLLTPGEMGDFLSAAETITLDTDYVTALGSADRVLEMNRALVMKPAVATWIRAVEEGSWRELIIATKAWEQRHTDLLIAELECQLAGTSVVQGVRFRRVGKGDLLQALVRLHDGRDPKLSAIAAGLSIMRR